MLRTRPKWPNATECCGREIQTTRLGRKRAWWAKGTAIEKFEQDIQPEIEAILRNVDIKDADIYFRIYMIGKNEEASRPTIMVCCADVSIGRRAKESLRDSSIIRNNAGFALGSIDFPLEQLVPVRGLAFEIQANNSLNVVFEASSDSAPEIQVFATSQCATIGRRLFVTHPWTMDIYRYSTGGVVVTAHGQFYQLTVGHITDLQDCAQPSSSMDPDACSFDGQSDSEVEDDLSIFEQDMRRASMSLFDLSDSGSSDAETERTTSNTINCRSPACTDYMTTNSDATGRFSHGLNEGLEPPPLIRVGRIASHSKEGAKPSLDYALVAIQTPREDDLINEITLDPRNDPKVLRIHDVADVGREERRVIAITGSGGVMKGTLIPGTTFLGRTNQQEPQKLYVVQLDGVVAEGDSGAAVLDEISGDLYGHMVSGCPGTRVAYIAAATEVFETLKTQLNGDVSIVSPRKMQKSPAQPSNANRQPGNLTEHQAQGVHCSKVLYDPLDSTSALPPIETHGSVEHGLHQRGECVDSTNLVHTSSSSIIEACDQLPKNTRLGHTRECSPSWVVYGEQTGEKIMKLSASHEVEPSVHITMTHDPALDIEASTPRLIGAKFVLSLDDLDENENGSFKSRKKTRKRKYPQRRRAKVREGTDMRRRTQENLTNQEEGDSRSFSSNKKFNFWTGIALNDNIPYVHLRDDGFEEDDHNLVYFFMTRNETESRLIHQAAFVDSFCGYRTLRDLQFRSRMLPSQNVCWLDDRTNDGKKSVSLGDHRPLTVLQLYLKLKEKRFYAREEHSPETSSSSSYSSRESYLPLSADRRLIFITDLDKYGVIALMATAPMSQASALGDAFYKHIAFKPDIGVFIEPRGIPFYSLSFHLPFYAWRSTPSQSCPRDSRLDRDDNPMRKVADISFLRERAVSQSGLDVVDYLCEAQISVLITGIDDHRWTGFCFADTYYESQDYRESVDDYKSDEGSSIRLDPFTEGRYDADFPLLNPWEYFLAVLDCRVQGFQKEWQILALNLQNRIDGYISECLSPPNQWADHSESPASADVKEALLWVGRTKQLLRILIQCLRATIKHWDCFEPLEKFQTVAGRKSISSIQKTFTDVGHCVDQLESLCVRCDDYAKHLALCMSCEENRDVKRQFELVKQSQILTRFLLYFAFPTILAAAMLSMQEKAIPRALGPDKSSFFVLAMVLACLVFVTFMLMNRSKYLQVLVRDFVARDRANFLRRSANPADHSEDIELGPQRGFRV